MSPDRAFEFLNIPGMRYSPPPGWPGFDPELNGKVTHARQQILRDVAPRFRDWRLSIGPRPSDCVIRWEGRVMKHLVHFSITPVTCGEGMFWQIWANTDGWHSQHLDDAGRNMQPLDGAIAARNKIIAKAWEELEA